jgi:hypothetical protein
MYPGVKNWVTTEKFAGRSGNTSGVTRRRKSRRRNLKRK